MLSPRSAAPETPSWGEFWPETPIRIAIDPNGNLTQKTENGETWDYVWNAENQLIRVCKDLVAPQTCDSDGVAIAAFKYDPVERRIERTESGVTTKFAYDGKAILRETVGATTATEYVQGPAVDEPLARYVAGGPTSFFHADVLGSVVAWTDGSGSLTQTVRYDSWGWPESGAASGYSFTGREFDLATGLHYYRARYYDGRLGRFISEDPIGFYGGNNFFAYVGNNPPKDVDPEGLYRIPRNVRGPDLAHCATDPVACVRKYLCFERANNQLQRRYGHDEDGTPGNAFKHCFWSCCISKAVGPARAMAATSAHEMIPNNPLCHFRMDTYNNNQGAGAAERFPSVGCGTICESIPLQPTPVGSCCGVGGGSDPYSRSDTPYSGPGPLS